jgi:hypothetical protein
MPITGPEMSVDESVDDLVVESARAWVIMKPAQRMRER